MINATDSWPRMSERYHSSQVDWLDTNTLANVLLSPEMGINFHP